MKLKMEVKNQRAPSCGDVPGFVSSFVDTFVDFCVSGLFLPTSRNIPEPSTPPPPLQTRYPTPRRLIAVGDLHGDLAKSKESLRLAGLIDASDKWVGGSATLVQIGDVLDRGGEEIKILYFLEKLKREAARTGGKVITMNGNHEFTNLESNFRYTTKEGFEEFTDWAHWFTIGNKMKGLCDGLEKTEDIFHGVPLIFPGVKEEFFRGIRARIAALRPGSPIARRFLSQNLTVLVVGESVFVHGGLLAEHVDYGLEKINEEVRNWINGYTGSKHAPDICRGKKSMVWLRAFSHHSRKDCDCGVLEHALATIPGAKRMIMGHTIQEHGITGVCDNKALRIDVGMSKGCSNGLPEVLEIIEDLEVRILTSNPLHNKAKESFLDADKQGFCSLILEDGQEQVVEVKA